jgi:hypothetical protein
MSFAGKNLDMNELTIMAYSHELGVQLHLELFDSHCCSNDWWEYVIALCYVPVYCG